MYLKPVDFCGCNVTKRKNIQRFGIFLCSLTAHTERAYCPDACKCCIMPIGVTAPSYLVRGNSHLGSDGSSSSETLANMGPSLDDSRAIRTSGVFEFMEELESKETCLGAKQNKNICYSL